ncbi:GNAT family N-acetyltransferase [Marinobacter sp. NFXS9]|uniref:GNAT family N-acetyltransferase n=1 Tax=Marinobacter sp. NFXS9 TaxID=2818433 RepID=UPI0032E03120
MVTYQRNLASVNEVEIHLKNCDAEFVPPLSERVRIEDYALKLVNHAQRFEAWYEGELAALVAMYCNDETLGKAFISSVSVAIHLRGQGIASKLIDIGVGYAQETSLRQVELEVDRRNVDARRLYLQKGFTVVSETGTNLLLQRIL